MNKLLRLIIILAIISISSPAKSEEITGYVVKVIDGDTVKVLSKDGTMTTIRLAEIDAPEKKQDYGMMAKIELYTIVYGKRVTVDAKTIDIYGRAVGRIICDGVDVNAEMVRNGSAWVYRQYSHDKRLIELEEKAKMERKGLWADPAIEPWVWRKNKR